MVINVVLLLSLKTKVILFFDNLLSLLSGQLLQVFLIEKQHDLLNMRVQLSNEGVDDALSRV